MWRISLLLIFNSVFAQSPEVIPIQIEQDHPQQTIEYFGASDAWSCQFAGNWPDSKRERIAELLFSKSSAKNGQPLGIGLNLWRFSIGAGSAAQGDSSTIRDEWHRQASFLDLNGVYHWDAMPGQLWFLKAAQKYGVSHFLAFVNSPHVRFTLNKKAYSDDGKCNLDFSKLNDFTADIVTTIAGIKKQTGIEMDYISPVNEPQWKWADSKQEGCPYTNDEISRVCRSLSSALLNEGLKTKIQIAEAGQLDYLYGQGKSKGEQIGFFFEKNSQGYLADLPNLDHSISGHSYFTTSPEKKAIDIRSNLAKEIAATTDLRFWMSEYCVLGDENLQGGGRDLGMETALFIAKLIHHDLTIANATSWQWWLAVSQNDYKDGLVYIDKNKEDGQVYDSKTLWAFGNYSRFVWPGSRRLISKMEPRKDFYVSSYLKDKKLSVIAVNAEDHPVIADLSFSGKQKYRKAQVYVTSAEYNLFPTKSYNTFNAIRIPARSVCTILLQ